jgi:hypothetical protein
VGLAASATTQEIGTRVTALMTFRKEILVIAGKDSEAGAIGALTAMRDQATEVVALREKVEAAETAAVAAEFGAHLDALAGACPRLPARSGSPTCRCAATSAMRTNARGSSHEPGSQASCGRPCRGA